MIKKYLVHAFKNTKIEFDPDAFISELKGFSYADLEKVCTQALKLSILESSKHVTETQFRNALRQAKRRRRREAQIEDGTQTG